MNRRITIIASIIYVCLLVVGFFYVRSVLKINKLVVSQKTEQKKPEDVKDITVNLILQLNANKEANMYTYRMKSSDKIMDLLVQARKDGRLYFEHDEYLYKTVIKLNDQPAPAGYRWVVADQTRDLTNNLNDINVTDGHAYIVGLVKI